MSHNAEFSAQHAYLSIDSLKKACIQIYQGVKLQLF